MEIYSIFNKYTNAWQSAIRQGIDFDEKGDANWQTLTSSISPIFNHDVADWILISEDDLEKYMQGYIRGEDGTPVAPTPIAKTAAEQADDISSKYSNTITELANAIAIADLQGDEDYKNELRAEYSSLIEKMSNELKAVNNND